MIEKATGTLGARKLLAHVRERYGTIPKFCDARGVNRLKVQKAIKGVVKRIDIPFALEIEKATDGEVAVPDWAVMVPDDDDRDTCPDSPPHGSAA